MKAKDAAETDPILMWPPVTIIMFNGMSFQIIRRRRLVKFGPKRTRIGTL